MSKGSCSAGALAQRLTGEGFTASCASDHRSTRIVLNATDQLAHLRLASPRLAEAFLDRGASAVVGWDEVVDLAHNDRGVLRLLLAIVGEKMSVEEAVRRTMIDVGPDPVYHSWPAAYINQGD